MTDTLQSLKDKKAEMQREHSRIKNKPTMRGKAQSLQVQISQIDRTINAMTADDNAIPEDSPVCKSSTMNEDVAFSMVVIRKYQNKVKNAAERGIEFSLSLQSFINLMKAKRCQYSGVPLTEPNGDPVATDRTIDRIDPKKGYIKGNVIVCCHAANQLKSFCEHGGLQGMSLGVKILSNAKKKMESVK